MIYSTLYWAGLIKIFSQVDNVNIDYSNESLDITIKGRDKTIQVSVNELNESLIASNNDPWKVVISLLNKNNVLMYYQNTLVGYFDIQAYSIFIEKATSEEAISKVSCLFPEIRSSCNTDINETRLDHWIMSDSIILVIDTNRCRLHHQSILCFLRTCANILARSMEYKFPVRGAIGGGYFYREGEILISSGLVDAACWEKEQDWLGAVLYQVAFYKVI
jgi:hypothetical protein